MLDTIKSILGLGPSVDYASLVKKGAIILDVRTNGEYTSGHISGSINIPIDQLKTNLNRFPDKSKPIITCCASGGRSSSAKNIFDSNGYKEVYNGGGWMRLRSRLS